MVLWEALCLLTSGEESSTCARTGSHWVGVLLTVPVFILMATFSWASILLQ